MIVSSPNASRDSTRSRNSLSSATKRSASVYFTPSWRAMIALACLLSEVDVMMVLLSGGRPVPGSAEAGYTALIRRAPPMGLVLVARAARRPRARRAAGSSAVFTVVGEGQLPQDAARGGAPAGFEPASPR